MHQKHCTSTYTSFKHVSHQYPSVHLMTDKWGSQNEQGIYTEKFKMQRISHRNIIDLIKEVLVFWKKWTLKKARLQQSSQTDIIEIRNKSMYLGYNRAGSKQEHRCSFFFLPANNSKAPLLYAKILIFIFILFNTFLFMVKHQNSKNISPCFETNVEELTQCLLLCVALA